MVITLVLHSNLEAAPVNNSFTGNRPAAGAIANNLVVHLHHPASPFGKPLLRGRSLHSRCGQQSSQHVSTLSCFGPKLRLKPELALLHLMTSTVDACANDVLVRSHFTGIVCRPQKEQVEMIQGLTIIVETTVGKKIAVIHSPCRMDF